MLLSFYQHEEIEMEAHINLVLSLWAMWFGGGQLSLPYSHGSLPGFRSYSLPCPFRLGVVTAS